MKTIFKLAIIVFGTIMISCDNDDGNAANQNLCVYEGLTYYDTSNQNTQTLIPETNLTTDFFPNNGGVGVPAVEIYKSDDISMVFTTNVVTLNASGIGDLIINNGPSIQVNVTCQRAGTQIGDEMRFDITASGVEAEFCVTIDDVTP